MNNERYEQIIDEAYKNYLSKVNNGRIYPNSFTQEEFINRIKTDQEFSEWCELKIEERELSLSERYHIMKNGDLNEWITVHYKEPKAMEYMDKYNILKRAITVTYNNEKIEVYE